MGEWEGRHRGTRRQDEIRTTVPVLAGVSGGRSRKEVVGTGREPKNETSTVETDDPEVVGEHLGES